MDRERRALAFCSTEMVINKNKAPVAIRKTVRLRICWRTAMGEMLLIKQAENKRRRGREEVKSRMKNGRIGAKNAREKELVVVYLFSHLVDFSPPLLSTPQQSAMLHASIESSCIGFTAYRGSCSSSGAARCTVY